MEIITQTIEQLERRLEELKEYFKKNLDVMDEKDRQKVEGLIAKVDAATKETAEKIRAIAAEATESTALKDFLKKVEDRSLEAFKCVKDEIDKKIGKSEVNQEIKKLDKEIEKNFASVKDSEIVSKAKEIIQEAKDRAKRFIEDPETQRQINEAKLKTIEIAEKGLEGLKKLLKAEPRD